MHRRDVLAAALGAATAGGLAGGAAGTPSTASDARTAQDAYEPLGTVELEGTRELVTNEDGSVGYVAVHDGIATLDLSDPTAPQVLTERRGLWADHENGPIDLLWDVWPDGDRLLAVGPANRAGSVNGALLFDVSDPADPTLLDTHETAHSIHNSHYEDGVAYLTGIGLRGNPVVMLDTEGDEFEEVGQWSPLDHDEAWAEVQSALRVLHDVSVQDGVAYLAYWDAGTFLVDVSDPSDPTYLGHVSEHDREDLAALDLSGVRTEYTTSPGNDHFVQVDETGDLLAVGGESWSVRRSNCVEGGASGVRLYDVSDPEDITHLSTVEPPESYLNTQAGGQFTTSHNFDIVGGRLYTSWYFGGVKVHDVSDPANPEELAWWLQPDAAAFWTARSAVPGEHFVASSADSVAGLDESIEGRIYVFPDEAGEQADRPSLTDAPADFEELPDCSEVENPGGENGDEGSGDDTDEDAGGSDDESDETAGAEETAADGEAGEDGDGDSLPGFGVATAIGGLGIAAARVLRRREE